MLYTSFNEKMYNEWHDDEMWIQSYIKKADDMTKLKKEVMEWIEDDEEGR